ncbi:hypothetical protein HKD37_19G053604 [Glycine soja]
MKKKKNPNLESVFEEFMAYHASSTTNQNSMKNHEIHFGKNYSIENFQGGQELQPYYQNEAEREIQVGELAEAVTQFMSRQEKSFVEAEVQEKSLEKDEEQAQQQWEKYSTVENQQENILQSNNLPHQLIDKKGRQGEHEETLSGVLSLITNTFLEMIWNVLPDYMKFMEFLARRRNFKEDVFFVTFKPP